MRDYYDDSNSEEDEEKYPEEEERLFDLQGLFQGEDNPIAIGYSASDTNKLALEAALRLLESSFWWKFKSPATKMQMLNTVYHQIQLLLSSDPQDDLLEDWEEAVKNAESQDNEQKGGE